MNPIKWVALAMSIIVGAFANAGTLLTCTQNGDSKLEAIRVNYDTESTIFSVTVEDPAALKPVAELKVMNGDVDMNGTLKQVNHWESRVGGLQLVAIFAHETSEFKHFYLTAKYGTDKDSHGSYGLLKFNELAEPNINWICEKG